MLNRYKLLFITVIILLYPSFATSAKLKFINYDSGYFNIQMPKGWNILLAGQCSNMAFVVRDGKRQPRQVFFFGSVGPVYMIPQQRQIDLNYVNMGGYPVAWIDMPVISPLTPENFMRHFSAIASSRIAQQFMPQMPRLENFKTVSVTEQPPMIYGGKTGLIRALFTKNGRIAEGMFICTVAPVTPFTGGTGGGLAYGFMVSGITAPKKEFSHIMPVLLKCLGSFKVKPSYINQCMQISQAMFQQVMQASKTLRETSDLIMKSWQNRNKTYDIIAEKQSDAILGVERVYDPDTGETYHVDPTFWEHYKSNRKQFRMNNLQLIPDNNYRLWNKVPKPQREIE